MCPMPANLIVKPLRGKGKWRQLETNELFNINSRCVNEDDPMRKAMKIDLKVSVRVYRVPYFSGTLCFTMRTPREHNTVRSPTRVIGRTYSSVVVLPRVSNQNITTISYTIEILPQSVVVFSVFSSIISGTPVLFFIVIFHHDDVV